MASDDKKTKASPAPKKDVAVKAETPSKKAAESTALDKVAPAADAPKAEPAEKVADPASGYSRGEGQKPVSQAYKDNWNAIFGNKAKTKPAKKPANKPAKKPAAKQAKKKAAKKKKR
jgi:hypothetical protein